MNIKHLPKIMHHLILPMIIYEYLVEKDPLSDDIANRLSELDLKEKELFEIYKALILTGKNWQLLQLIPKDDWTDELCEQAVSANGRALQIIPEERRTKKMYELAIANAPRISDYPTLMHVPDQFISQEMCEREVARNANFMATVPERFKTDSLYERLRIIFHVGEQYRISETDKEHYIKIMAGKQFPWKKVNELTGQELLKIANNSFGLIPHRLQTKELLELYLGLITKLPLQSWNIDTTQFKSELQEKLSIFLWTLAKTDTSVLRIFNPEAVKQRVKEDPEMGKLVIAAANDCPEALNTNLNYIPEEYMTEDMCRKFVLEKPDNFKYIPDQFKSYVLCEDLFNNKNFAYPHLIPEQLWDENLRRHALSNLGSKNIEYLVNLYNTLPDDFHTTELYIFLLSAQQNSDRKINLNIKPEHFKKLLDSIFSYDLGEAKERYIKAITKHPLFLVLFGEKTIFNEDRGIYLIIIQKICAAILKQAITNPMIKLEWFKLAFNAIHKFSEAADWSEYIELSKIPYLSEDTIWIQDSLRTMQNVLEVKEDETPFLLLAVQIGRINFVDEIISINPNYGLMLDYSTKNNILHYLFYAYNTDRYINGNDTIENTESNRNAILKYIKKIVNHFYLTHLRNEANLDGHSAIALTAKKREFLTVFKLDIEYELETIIFNQAPLIQNILSKKLITTGLKLKITETNEEVNICTIENALRETLENIVESLERNNYPNEIIAKFNQLLVFVYAPESTFIEPEQRELRSDEITAIIKIVEYGKKLQHSLLPTIKNEFPVSFDDSRKVRVNPVSLGDSTKILVTIDNGQKLITDFFKKSGSASSKGKHEDKCIQGEPSIKELANITSTQHRL